MYFRPASVIKHCMQEKANLWSWRNEWLGSSFWCNGIAQLFIYQVWSMKHDGTCQAKLVLSYAWLGYLAFCSNWSFFCCLIAFFTTVFLFFRSCLPLQISSLRIWMRRCHVQYKLHLHHAVIYFRYRAHKLWDKLPTCHRINLLKRWRP